MTKIVLDICDQKVEIMIFITHNIIRARIMDAWYRKIGRTAQTRTPR
jgi:hypothetical protein